MQAYRVHRLHTCSARSPCQSSSRGPGRPGSARACSSPAHAAKPAPNCCARRRRPGRPACRARPGRPRACPRSASRRSAARPAGRRSCCTTGTSSASSSCWSSSWSHSAVATRLLGGGEEADVGRHPGPREHDAGGHRVPVAGLVEHVEAGEPAGAGSGAGRRRSLRAHFSRRRIAASRPMPPTIVTSSGASSGGPISML